MQLLLMAIAGALGTLARYGVTLACQRYSATNLHSFPLGTLTVNVLGSLLLGFLTATTLKRVPDEHMRLIIGTGFLGAFTTFSTFELEAQRLIADKNWSHLTLYVSGNLILGLLAILAGIALASKIGS